MAAAVLVAGAALWEYGRGTGVSAPDLTCVVLAAAGLHFAGTRWLVGRNRRADFRWRRTLPVPGDVRPGLSGRWSRSALAVDAGAAVGVVGSGLVFFGARVGADSLWSGSIGSVLAGGWTLVLAVSAFGRLRRPWYVVVTSLGVAARGHDVSWERIGSVYRDREGVHLRLAESESPRYVRVSGPRCAVPDERIAEVIEFYRADPHRRAALDSGRGLLIN
ncbi:hypothetical protein ACI2K4_04040 [Micromonospora sp. NPDC050397]|uniref:hypothetical protein n=1 Tax=Micromonospora sp. NPDC050397 TaxID=3364279 RepID=UPI00385172F1